MEEDFEKKNQNLRAENKWINDYCVYTSIQKLFA